MKAVGFVLLFILFLLTNFYSKSKILVYLVVILLITVSIIEFSKSILRIKKMISFNLAKALTLIMFFLFGVICIFSNIFYDKNSVTFYYEFWYSFTFFSFCLAVSESISISE